MSKVSPCRFEAESSHKMDSSSTQKGVSFPHYCHRSCFPIKTGGIRGGQVSLCIPGYNRITTVIFHLFGLEVSTRGNMVSTSVASVNPCCWGHVTCLNLLARSVRGVSKDGTQSNICCNPPSQSGGGGDVGQRIIALIQAGQWEHPQDILQTHLVNWNDPQDRTGLEPLDRLLAATPTPI